MIAPQLKPTDIINFLKPILIATPGLIPLPPMHNILELIGAEIGTVPVSYWSVSLCLLEQVSSGMGFFCWGLVLAVCIIYYICWLDVGGVLMMPQACLILRILIVGVRISILSVLILGFSLLAGILFIFLSALNRSSEIFLLILGLNVKIISFWVLIQVVIILSISNLLINCHPTHHNLFENMLFQRWIDAMFLYKLICHNLIVIIKMKKYPINIFLV